MTSNVRRVMVALVLAATVVACGGDDASGPKAGIHDKGGSDAYNASLVAENVIADVTVDPAKVGEVLVHMELTPPGGKLERVSAVTGNLIPSDTSLSTIILWFEESDTNHFHVDVDVPTPGEWTLEFDATLPDGTAALYTTKIVFGS